MENRQFSVYKITCLDNNKIYVGQTYKTLRERLFDHFSCARSGVDTKFYRAIRKHGEDKFVIELIEVCDSQETLDEREFFWIQKLNSVKLGYNTKNSKGKCGGDTLSNHPNKEAISAKISSSKMLNKNPHSTPVKAKNIETNQELFFESMREAQQYFDLPRHDIISKRCRGDIKVLLNGWTFAYLENEYVFTEKIRIPKPEGRSGVHVCVLDHKTGERTFYKSIADAVKQNGWSQGGVDNVLYQRKGSLYKGRFEFIR